MNFVFVCTRMHIFLLLLICDCLRAATIVSQKIFDFPATFELDNLQTWYDSYRMNWLMMHIFLLILCAQVEEIQ